MTVRKQPGTAWLLLTFTLPTKRASQRVEVEGFADLDAQCARSDLLDQILERRPHEIFRFASIGGQADRSRDSLHWGEIVEGPFVADNTGHANDAALLGATQ